jgi:UDP-N-acetylglucosamine 2-epimerase (non-hydrolysing)
MSEIIFVVGARPNFIKVAPVIRAMRQTHVLPRLVHTGQHYDKQMSDVFFRQLQLPDPDVHLGVGSGPHGAQTAKILEAFEIELITAGPRPLGVVVVGDVNSTFACALAAVKLGIQVAHIEAGLRSFDRSMPEEINRVLTDAISDLLFVTEPSGEENLRKEGIAESKIKPVGNVMIDTLVHELPEASSMNLDRLEINVCPFALVTLHRPSNVDGEPMLSSLVEFLCRISTRLPVVFPLHPRTRQRLDEFGLMSRLAACPSICLLGPLGYHENLACMMRARIVITDSGGIQEESSYLGIPCLTLRSNTERPVTVTHGTNTIIGSDLNRAENLIADALEGRYKTSTAIPGWDGHASTRIVNTLLHEWGTRKP